MPRCPHRALWLEGLALFVLLPLALMYGDGHRLLYPLLLAAFALVVTWLRRQPAFERRCLWNAAAARRQLRPILTRWLGAAALLALLVRLLAPEHYLDFPRRAPLLWGAVILLYPLLSAYPQEVIFRTFFFQRYRPLFPSRFGLIAASALAFGFAHILLRNGVAVVLSAAAGALFAATYERSRSTLAAAVEHALYGNLMFTLGLGSFFYHGAVS